MSGYYLMYRGTMEHTLFKGGIYTKFQAWEWLIANAAWKATKTGIGGKTVELQEGQLSYSIRYMAEAWKWPKSVTERFINRLKTETMIGTETRHNQLIITICNYEIYQHPQSADRDNTVTPDGTAAGQGRDSSGTNKNTLNSGNTESKPSSKVKRATKVLRFFEDDEPLDPDFYGVAAEYPGLDIQAEWEKFRDYHVTKQQGTGSIKASARTWCKNAVAFQQRTNLRLVR